MSDQDVPVLSLSLGSNIDAEANIRRALDLLSAEFRNLRCSTVYESEAVGFEGDNFLNLVVTAQTDMNLSEISRFLKQIEEDLGRDRSQPRFSSRSMDIDILTFGDDDGGAWGLSLPRHEITKNAFVLQPLAEMLPDEIHPESGLTYAQLWEEFDQQNQKLWPISFSWTPGSSA